MSWKSQQASKALLLLQPPGAPQSRCQEGLGSSTLGSPAKELPSPAPALIKIVPGSADTPTPQTFSTSLGHQPLCLGFQPVRGISCFPIPCVHLIPHILEILLCGLRLCSLPALPPPLHCTGLNTPGHCPSWHRQASWVASWVY